MKNGFIFRLFGENPVEIGIDFTIHTISRFKEKWEEGEGVTQRGDFENRSKHFEGT